MKRLILILALLLLSVIAFSQEKRNIIINAGISDKCDFSLLVGGKFVKNFYGGLEYSHNTEINKNNSLVCIGYSGKRAIILAKGGLCYTQIYDIPKVYPLPLTTFDKIMKTEFDYGLEYLWVNNIWSKASLCYGLSYTHCNGVQLKLGASF